MDVERMVAQRLMDETGIEAVLDVPADTPSEFISVSQTGSSRSGCINRVQLVAQSWAKTRRRAAEIAEAVEHAVPSLMDEECVFEATCGDTYRWDDPDSRQRRYQTNVNVTICE